MTEMRGFCEITETSIFEGLGWENPIELYEASIELDGEITEFWLNKEHNRTARASSDYKNRLHVEINFVPDLKKGERFDHNNFDSTLYIGELILRQEEKEIYAYAYFEWTLSMFLFLRSMRGRRLNIEIYYHETMNKNKSKDDIVGRCKDTIGLIKYVKFKDIDFSQPKEPPQKRCIFSF